LKKVIITALIFSLITGCASVPQPEIYNYKINSKAETKGQTKKIINAEGEIVYIISNNKTIIDIEKLSKKYDSINDCQENLTKEIEKIKNIIQKESENKFYSTNVIRGFQIAQEVDGLSKDVKTEIEKSYDFKIAYTCSNIKDTNDFHYLVSIESEESSKMTLKQKAAMATNVVLAIVFLPVIIIAIPIAHIMYFN